MALPPLPRPLSSSQAACGRHRWDFLGAGAPEWEFVNEHSRDPHGKQGRGEKKQDWEGEDAELRGLSQQGGGFRMLRPLHPLPGSIKPGRLNHGQGWGLQAGDPERADSCGLNVGAFPNSWGNMSSPPEGVLGSPSQHPHIWASAGVAGEMSGLAGRSYRE